MRHREKKSKPNGKITFPEATSMAVGTMIGASIFSIFGIGAQIAGKDLPEAFVLSGILAFIVGYSYAKMGSKIVSNAGPIAFILRGFGDTLTTGALSILMWLSYVVSISLFVKGFTGYLLPLINISPHPLVIGIVEALVISLFTALNFFGSKTVGKTEFYIVLLKLFILGIFIVFGLFTIRPELISPAYDTKHMTGIVNAAVIFFLSYMGFGLVTNASENMENPKKNVPKAIYTSIGIVIMVYVLVSIVAVGNLPIGELVTAKENALAVAAQPILGSFGFVLLSLGALFSISSALNATLYGGANVAYSLAKDGELPQVFERKVWFKSREGLYLTAGLGLLLALLFNINGIASITSAVFIVIYIFVILSHYKTADEIGGNKIIILINAGTISLVLAVLFYYQLQTQVYTFIGTIAMFVGAFFLEWQYRKITKRSFKERPHS